AVRLDGAPEGPRSHGIMAVTARRSGETVIQPPRLAPSWMGGSLPVPLMIGPDPAVSRLPHHQGAVHHRKTGHHGNRRGLRALHEESLPTPEHGQSTSAS